MKQRRGKGIAWLRAHVGYTGDDCVPWPFCRDERIGRGIVGYQSRRYWAHRLMCILAHGEPPTPKHQAAHSCGKGHYGCCNPRHLSWKTNSENQLDRRKNGNMLRNTNGPKATISPQQISQIYVMRKSGMAQTAIAAKLGVSLGCIQYWLKYRAERGNDQGKLRVWGADEDMKLRRLWAGGKSREEIATELGRSIGSVRGRIERLPHS